MFKISYKHKTLESLELTQNEFEDFLLGRDSYFKSDWQIVLTVFGIVRIKL